MKTWCSEPSTLARIRLNRAGWSALLRQLVADRGQHLAEAPHLLERRLVVDPVDEVRVGLLEDSAAATLAWIMNSSMSRWASSRSGTRTRSTVPSGFRTILRSGRSRALARVAGPRQPRRRPRAA